MNKELEVFKKEYSGEELCDLSRDIDEAFDERFNPIMNQVPTDIHNFHEGKFVVTMVWKAEE